jgi:hypothetical protein
MAAGSLALCSLVAVVGADYYVPYAEVMSGAIHGGLPLNETLHDD